eukprot:687479-Amphidinium_carterae.1
MNVHGYLWFLRLGSTCTCILATCICEQDRLGQKCHRPELNDCGVDCHMRTHTRATEQRCRSNDVSAQVREVVSWGRNATMLSLVSTTRCNKLMSRCGLGATSNCTLVGLR